MPITVDYVLPNSLQTFLHQASCTILFITQTFKVYCYSFCFIICALECYRVKESRYYYANFSHTDWKSIICISTEYLILSSLLSEMNIIINIMQDFKSTAELYFNSILWVRLLQVSWLLEFLTPIVLKILQDNIGITKEKNTKNLFDITIFWSQNDNWTTIFSIYINFFSICGHMNV